MIRMILVPVLIVVGCFLFPGFLYSSDDSTRDDVLRFDERPYAGQELYIRNEENIFPEYSDFRLIFFSPMSNRKGDRWALVSLENTASGSRILTDKHILATFADGTKRFPSAFEVHLKAGESYSESIEFGYSRFPIVKVETRLKN